MDVLKYICYDNHDRLAAIISRNDQGVHLETVRYSWDGLGRLMRETIEIPD